MSPAAGITSADGTALSGSERRKPLVCLITNELYPLSAGGIGRLMFNFARRNTASGRPVELHYLVAAEIFEDEDNRRRVVEAFGDHAEVHPAPRLEDDPSAFSRLMARALSRPWTFDSQFALSCQYYHGLVDAERRLGRPFDYIEFPDFGGWSIASVEAQRAGLAFQTATIVARLHSTQGVICRNDRFAHHPALWNGVQFDGERHLLEHAGLIVGHVEGVVAHNESHYGLAARWRGRTVCEFPPIMLDESVQTDDAVEIVDEARMAVAGAHGIDRLGDLDPDFVFSSRFQQFKRPDLFVRAAVIFLENRPEYTGLFRLISYGWDKDYIDWLRSLVPPCLAGRIVFQFGTRPDVREAFIRTSIVVVPSSYESLCLFAHEAGAMGCRVILNRACVAFGSAPRWIDGENCLMFDGTAPDLARVMAEAILWSPSSMVDTSATEPYWAGGRWARPPVRVAGTALPSMSLVCHGHTLREHVLEQMAQLSHGQDGDVDVVFLLANALFRDDAELVRHVEAFGWRVEWMPGYGDDPRSLALRLAGFDSDLIAFLPHGYELHRGFLGRARTAFAGDETLSLVGGQVRIIDDATGRPDVARVYAGNMPSLAMVSSRVAPRASVVRRSLIARRPFESEAGALWFEAWTRDLAMAGESLLILPEFAADLAAQHDHGENSKHLSGGIVDRMCQEAGLRARGLALDPVIPPERSDERYTIVQGDALGQARRRLPRVSTKDFDLVANRSDHGGLLVHPTDASFTVAELAGPERRLRLLEADVRNVLTENSGVEVAIALAGPAASDEDIEAMATTGADAAGGAISDWVRVPPGADAHLSLAVTHASHGRDRVLLMTRVPPNGDDAYAHLVFQRVVQHFSTSEP